MVSGNDAHGEAGLGYWTTPNPCAEPMCEAAESPSPVSSGVLVTVKSMIYSNKGYCCSVLNKARNSFETEQTQRFWQYCTYVQED